MADTADTADLRADTADLRAAVTLAGRGVAITTTMIRDLHRAIARRAFTATGPNARPAHVIHDAISTSVYAAVSAGARLAGTATGIAVAARAATDPSYRPLAERPKTATAIGALNGAWGDWLDRTNNPLAIPMTARYDERQTSPTGDVAVWLHGLCETDASWRLGAFDHYGDPHSTHGQRLYAECGLTPVYVRYNTGLHISANGRRLDDVLTELVGNWPVPITRLTLIGHSMGGLVIRAAAAHGCEHDASWIPLAKRVVYLGSPHLGAPLEVGASRATRFLKKLPETKPLADALASRSVGIKDLRYGDILDADWSGLDDLDDLDASRPKPVDCAPLLGTAEHYYIGATLGARPDTRVARIVGDAFVPFASASGTSNSRTLGLDVDRGRHLGGLHHFDLLNHPRVYAVLREWLTR